jgi:hypothetical protein
MAGLRTEAIGLYKHCMRCVQKLPSAAQSYYRNYVKQNFVAHLDETDPERISHMLSRSRRDIQWVMQKYGVQSKC